MHIGTMQRGLAAIAFAASLALAGGGLASADVELGDHGHFGPHQLDDADFSPGVTCNYGTHPSAYRLTRVRVKAPYVHAAGADPQKVGWDFQLQFGTSENGPWKLVATSQRHTATGTASSIAPFKPMSVAVDAAKHGHYRVIMGIYWYKHGSINGHSRHRLEWYKAGSSLPKPFAVGSDCAGVLPKL
jgi:hypothetical protein